MPIFDQGYQHWSGDLSSYGWRWLAITRRGVRTALQVRMVRMALILAFMPAILLVVALCLWGLIERQSASIEAFKPYLTMLLGQPILAGPREYRVEFIKLCLRFVVVRQSGGTCDLVDDRIERAVRVLRRAEIAQACVLIGREAFKKRGRQPRFPDTWLAG